MDFTIKKYKNLLISLKNEGYLFLSPNSLWQGKSNKFVFLRHDVERRFGNTMSFAEIESRLDIHATYYFRYGKGFPSLLIKELATNGHTIGYHYDDLSYCKGNYEAAIERFANNLEALGNIISRPVKTISMEGAPLSKWDNRDLWKKYDYRDFGIEFEPYLDTDFNKTFYLTDTGRRWDGWKVSVRDKVPQQEEWIKKGLVFHSTNDIIKAVKEGRLPDKVMMTFHPQRWSDKPLPWLKEWGMQNAKNMVKKMLIKKNTDDAV